MKNSISNASVSCEEFQWPEHSSDRARIKDYSQRFKEKSVVESFQEIYGLDLSSVSEKANELPREYRIGDTIKTRILSVAKDAPRFESSNFKGTINSAVNLYKYSKLRAGSDRELTAVVTDVKKDRITIDPIRPMTEAWIEEVTTKPVLQKVIGSPRTVRVKNLQWTSGGFTGKAVVPVTSEFVGEEVYVDAFIPGSQIVLNITDNFEQFIGQDVDAFVLNYIPRGTTMSLICSVKEYLTFQGQLSMIHMFNKWCDNAPEWNDYAKMKHMGKVTGVINSSRKCGVFVEIPDLMITGMLPVPADELVGYKPGDDVCVSLDYFDEEMFYNKDSQQMQHVIPYVIEDGVLLKCNLKPIFKLA